MQPCVCSYAWGDIFMVRHDGSFSPKWMAAGSIYFPVEGASQWRWILDGQSVQGSFPRLASARDLILKLCVNGSPFLLDYLYIMCVAAYSWFVDCACRLSRGVPMATSFVHLSCVQAVVLYFSGSSPWIMRYYGDSMVRCGWKWLSPPLTCGCLWSPLDGSVNPPSQWNVCYPYMENMAALCVSEDLVEKGSCLVALSSPQCMVRLISVLMYCPQNLWCSGWLCVPVPYGMRVVFFYSP